MRDVATDKMKHEDGYAHHIKYVIWKSGSQETGRSKVREGCRNMNQKVIRNGEK